MFNFRFLRLLYVGSLFFGYTTYTFVYSFQIVIYIDSVLIKFVLFVQILRLMRDNSCCNCINIGSCSSILLLIRTILSAKPKWPSIFKTFLSQFSIPNISSIVTLNSFDVMVSSCWSPILTFILFVLLFHRFLLLLVKRLFIHIFQDVCIFWVYSCIF